MESEWVKIMPFIEKPLPFTAVNSDFPGVSESKEIYDYFFSRNPNEPIEDFKRFYSALPAIPRTGQSKIDQIMEAVRLMKLADTVKSQMDKFGISDSIMKRYST